MAATHTAPPASASTGDRAAQLLARLQAGAGPSPVHREAFTGAYWAAQRRPEIVRLAAGIANTYRMMPAVIGPCELIVGGDYLRQIAGFGPSTGIYCDDEFARQVVAGEPSQAPQVEQILETWRGRTTEELIRADRTRREQAVADNNVLAAAGLCGPSSLDFRTILTQGVNGLQAATVSARNRLATQEGAAQEVLDLYEALLVVADGIIEFAQNHSLAARQLAQQESDPKRRQELRVIAAICRRMPARPAATLHEALQSLWFVHLLDGCCCLGRLDQLLWPYLRRDLESGELSLAQAQELVDCFWLKLGEARSGPVCLAGLQPDGSEGANRVTDLCLSAQERLSPGPRTMLRWHSDAGDELLESACRLVTTQADGAVLYNDDAVVPTLRAADVHLADARDYAPTGPGGVAVSGKSHVCVEGGVSVAKCLELALNDGVCRRTGHVLGPRTGDPRQFPSYYHLLEAHKRQVAHFAGAACELANRAQRIRAETAPNLLRTLFVADCIQHARSYDAGGARYNAGHIIACGLANAAHSLCAVKRAVFEQRAVDLPTLVDALDADFEGDEDLWRELGRVRRGHGEDGAGADEVAGEMIRHWRAEAGKHCAWRGGTYDGMPGLPPADPEFGLNCGALPDGRRAWTPLTDWLPRRHDVDAGAAGASRRCAATLPTQTPCLTLEVARQSTDDAQGVRRLAALVQDYLSLGAQRIHLRAVEPDEQLRA